MASRETTAVMPGRRPGIHDFVFEHPSVKVVDTRAMRGHDDLHDPEPNP